MPNTTTHTLSTGEYIGIGFVVFLPLLGAIISFAAVWKNRYRCKYIRLQGTDLANDQRVNHSTEAAGVQNRLLMLPEPFSQLQRYHTPESQQLQPGSSSQQLQTNQSIVINIVHKAEDQDSHGATRAIIHSITTNETSDSITPSTSGASQCNKVNGVDGNRSERGKLMVSFY